MGKTIRIAIADRDTGSRDRLARLLRHQPDFVVAELDSARALLGQVRKDPPDLLVLDMELPGMSGLEILGKIRSIGCRVVALTDLADAHELAQALLMGAAGALERSTPDTLVVRCVRSVLAGELWFRREVTGALLSYTERRFRENESFDGAREVAGHLTPREGDIFRAVARGMSNREIANRLKISEYTVKHHLTRMFAKLGVSNRVELALLASKHHS